MAEGLLVPRTRRGGVNMERIRILVADDHTMFRRGLLEILGKEDDLEVVGEASDGKEAVEKARTTRPHVVLMDVHMPNCNGIEATRQLQAEMPEIRVLMLTISAQDVDLLDSIAAGAQGYVLKSDEPEQLVQAIRFVVSGGTLVSPAMADILLKEVGADRPRVAQPPLSSVEETVLQLLARGHSDAVIAYRLSTIETVVRTLIGNISHKLRLANRREAVVAYAKHVELAGSSGKRAIKPVETAERGATLEIAGLAGEEPHIPHREAQAFDMVGLVEIAIAPPVEPAHILRLYRWLNEVGKATIRDISGAWGADTVLTVNLSGRIPIFDMLNELPFVAEVTIVPGSASTPRRFHLVLKDT